MESLGDAVPRVRSGRHDARRGRRRAGRFRRAAAGGERPTPRGAACPGSNAAVYRITAASGASGEVEVARQTLAVAETFQRLAQLQFEAGDVPLSNVLRSQIEVENASQALLAAETAYRLQQAALNAALVQPVAAPLTLPAIAGVTLRTYDLAALQEMAVQGPALRAAEATLAARRAAVAVARAARRP